MFGILICIPMAKATGMQIFEIVIASLLLVEVSYFLYKGLPFVDTLTDYLVRIMSDWWVNWKGLDESESKRVYRYMYLTTIMAHPFLLWLFFSPLLKVINPALNGLTLIIALLFTFFLYLAHTSMKDSLEG
jgi:uncharacterized membrane protein